MAYAMTKRGSLDNCVTYEFICDTVADMNAIEDRYRTIGSTAVVLQGDAGLEVYISGSDKTWTSLSVINSGSVPSGGGLSFHICGQDELDANGLPDVSEPDEVTFYLVPAADETTGNIYDEYIYVDDEWERFGSGGTTNIDLSAYAPKANPEFTGSISMNRDTNGSIGTNSFATGYYVTASGSESHAEGNSTCASAPGSHAEGRGNGLSTHNYSLYNQVNPNAFLNGRISPISSQIIPGASGDFSHSEGYYTAAQAQGSHAEGQYTVANGGGGQHAEGMYTYTSGAGGEHAEGMYTFAAGGGGGHAEGKYTMVSGGGGEHAEGQYTFATGNGAAHAEGYGSLAQGSAAHAEGCESKATADYSHAEGYKTQAKSNNAHSEGQETQARAQAAHAEGYHTDVTGNYAHVEGYYTQAGGTASHAEGCGGQRVMDGVQSGAYASYSHVEGEYCYASNSAYDAHAEGCGTTVTGSAAHAEGQQTIAKGTSAHAEGIETEANGSFAHTEGNSTIANGSGSHAEGCYTIANGNYNHVFGKYNVEDSFNYLPEWTANTSYEVGDIVKVTTISGNETTIQAYKCKTANNDDTFTSNKWNWYYQMQYVEIVGNGETNARSNARTLDWEGNERLMGDLYVGCNANSTGGTKVATAAQLSDYAPIANPAFTGSISLGRKANTTVGINSSAVGNNVEASGDYSHAEGAGTVASGEYSHAEGSGTTASGVLSHAEGANSNAINTSTHAEGAGTTASGVYSHAEGVGTIAGGPYSHAEGVSTKAYGDFSHAEGASVVALGALSHVQGQHTISAGSNQHIIGKFNQIEAIPAWVSSTEYEVGDLVSREETLSDNITYTRIYRCKTANSDATFDSSKWEESGLYAEIVGNGTADNARSNARALDWDGNERLMGDLYVGCNADSTGGTKLARIPDAPSTDGTYTLQCVVTNGEPTYTWISTGA